MNFFCSVSHQNPSDAALELDLFTLQYRELTLQQNTANLLKWLVVYPGFPQGGCANPPGGANIQFCQIYPKTA